ncbi:hypothetical protein DER45DRAFT_537259 [Fusarium avenaceum]|nr:hypothetical protein DER45DRAFT_537259 [Fusarium avenaceum]
MATAASNLGLHHVPPPVPKARAGHSISDSSRPRGRVVFTSRRPSHVRQQTKSIPRHGCRSVSSPNFAASQTIAEGLTPLDAGTVTRHQSHSNHDAQPEEDVYSVSECLSEADLVTLKDARRTVSLLHTSELDLLTPPRKVSCSTLTGNTPGCNILAAHTQGSPFGVLTPDAFGVVPVNPKAVDVNNELINAISRNIAQQLHILTIKDEGARMHEDLEQLTPKQSGSLSNESRTPSQREALNRFTRELHQYAEQSGAKGRLPIFTPTPPASGVSLHTINALLPFRSEFKAAGLAVTSRDQGKSSSRPAPSGKPRGMPNQASKSRLKQPQLTQVDSNAGCPSSSTEIPFPAAKDMDEWRYSMVDRHGSRRRTAITVHQESQTCCPPCRPGDLCLWSDWNCLQPVQKTKPLYPESSNRELLTGPTARIPKTQMHTFPEWPDISSSKKGKSRQHDNHNKRAVSNTPRASRSSKKKKEQKPAFFSGPKTPTACSSLSIESNTQLEPRHSLDDHRYHTRTRSHKHKHRLAEPHQDQSPCSRPVQSMKNLKQPQLAQPCLKRSQSLSADILVPRWPISTKRSEKPLPEIPQPGSSSTSTEQSCRLSTGAETLLPTSNKVSVNKGKEKELAERESKHPDSAIPPNHVTVCSRGFSGQRLGRPNVPKRTSSIQSLRTTHRDHDHSAIMDRDVLRGLHIAASAACNELIDTFIHEQTGLHIRRFLADLMPLESLGNKPARETKEKRARRRRAEIREVKRRVRRSRQIRERGAF